jgi:hypothetical protein
VARRIQPGDVLEVAGSGGLLYLCYVGKHPEYGDAVDVCPVEQTTRPEHFEGLFRSAYVTFYPAAAAVARGLASVVGRATCAGMPRILRRPGARSGLTVKTWIIEDGSGESMKQQLSADELRLPIAVIWNHELLLERVRAGWRPETEGCSMSGDRAALEELSRVSKAGARQTILHYLYLPSKVGAAEVAARLRSHGFSTEERPGADGINWLVLAIQEVVPSESTIAAARTLMEEVAGGAGGEYDGWEAEVR